MRNLVSRSATTSLLILLTGFVFALPTRGQQVSTPTSPRQLLRVVNYNGDLAALLQTLAEQYGVTIGLEADPRQPQPQVNFEVRDATFHDVLDAIVRAKPMYQWREVDGAVDFYPVAGGSPVLDAVIGSFRVSDAKWAAASDALMKLPEVESGMSGMGLRRQDAERGTASRGGDVFSMHLEGVTVRRALHEMTAKSGSRFWVFRQFRGGEKFYSLGNSAR
ncbi:MAG TPA: DotD/TraH family lipoprotein [Pyrinomonadaceae bacterium]|nr:DotD/TraH family lipoprotein [Pyrinomonadaceae bacterium]